MKKFILLFLILNLYSIISNGQTDTSLFFAIAEKMPQFPGGENEMNNFIAKNINYPIEERNKNIQGRVYVSFIIESTGQLGNIKILKGITNGDGLTKEAIRVLESMPLWIPGEQNNNKVRVRINMPVLFTITSDTVSGNSESSNNNNRELDSLEVYIKNETKGIENKALGFIQICLQINKLGKVILASRTHSVIVGDKINVGVLKAFQNINEKSPEIFSRFQSDTSVCFNIFVDSKKEVIVDYALQNKDSLMRPSQVAYLTGVKNSDEKLFQRAIKLYCFAAYAGYQKVDCYYNIGATYFNIKDTSSACQAWIEAAKEGDSESAKYILLSCPDLAASNGITPQNLKANQDTIMYENNIYQFVEVMPKFKEGGEIGFLNYIARNFHYPLAEREKGIMGKVFVQFVIRDDGTLVDASIIKGVAGGPGLDNEALRVIQSSPKWIPGTQNGKAVNVYYRVPVSYSLL